MAEMRTPQTLEQALATKVQNPGLIPYAGGTDWMVNRRDNAPLLFINYIPELRVLRQTEDGLFIGACCTYAQLLESPIIPELLRLSVREVASPAIRNLGTLGGNICNASPAGDTLPALYVLDARVRLASVRGRREILLADFIRGVRKIDLAPDELLEAIILPKADWSGIYYQKVGARSATAISKASFAAAVRLENGLITTIPIAFGSVAVTVVRRPELEARLYGRTPEELRAAKDEILDWYEPYIRPIDDQRSTADYRKAVCLGLLGDFLSQV